MVLPWWQPESWGGADAPAPSQSLFTPNWGAALRALYTLCLPRLRPDLESGGTELGLRTDPGRADWFPGSAVPVTPRTQREKLWAKVKRGRVLESPQFKSFCHF